MTLAGTQDGVVLWDLTRVADVRTLQGDGVLEDMTFTADGSAIAAVTNTVGRSGARLWDVDDGSITSEYPVSDEWSSEAVSPDGAKAAHLMFGPETRVQITNLDNGTGVVFNAYETEIKDYQNYTVTMAFSDDGTVLATGWWFRHTSGSIADEDAELRLWDADTGELLLAVEGFGESSITHIDFSPDGSMVATAGDAGKVRVWNTRDGILVAEQRTSDRFILGLDFTPGGSLVIGTGRGLTIWDIAEGTTADYTVGEDASVHDVSASPDGRYVALIVSSSALGSSPDGVVIWDIETAAEAASFPGSYFLGFTEFSPDGSSLALFNHWPIRIADVSFLQDPYSEVCDQAGRELTDEEWDQYLGDLSRGSLDVCG